MRNALYNAFPNHKQEKGIFPEDCLNLNGRLISTLRHICTTTERKDDAKMAEGKFKSVSLGAGLLEEVTNFVKTNKLYKSNAEFIAEAARLRMIELIKLDLALTKTKTRRS